MSEFGDTREMRVATDTSIECPICEEFIELKLSVKIVISQPIPNDGSSQVFMGLLTKESSSLHSCWPKEEKL